MKSLSILAALFGISTTIASCSADKSGLPSKPDGQADLAGQPDTWPPAATDGSIWGDGAAGIADVGSTPDGRDTDALGGPDAARSLAADSGGTDSDPAGTGGADGNAGRPADTGLSDAPGTDAGVTPAAETGGNGQVDGPGGGDANGSLDAGLVDAPGSDSGDAASTETEIAAGPEAGVVAGPDGPGATPSIIAFTASPTTISEGQSATLSWGVMGATMLSINQGVGLVTGRTSEIVTPTRTTTYTLTVQNLAGESASAQLLVTVVPLPTIVGFTAAPATISVGSSATLTAVFSNGTTATADNGIGNVTTAVGIDTGPLSSSTTYTLTVTNAAGDSVTATATVTVVPLPTISSFTAAPTSITTGRTTELTATFANGTGAIDHSIGTVSSGVGIDTLVLSATTTFTLTVTNAAGSHVTAQATVTVIPLATIASFLATPPSVAVGASTTLTAVFTNGSTGIINNGIGSVASGIGVSTGALSANTTYTLTVTNALGDPVTANATVTVAGPGSFAATGRMTTGRQYHTATLLQTGKVLVAGGYALASLSSAELYDPATGTFTATGPMSVARQHHTATLLDNGKVLIAGGYATGTTNLSSAELYDPATGTFTATGTMTAARSTHTATLLSNQKVLIAGGSPDVLIPTTSLLSAELYDPELGSFTATGSMNTARANHSATPLNTGKVLLAGGSAGPGDLYDPVGGSFKMALKMGATLSNHSATLLSDGEVLFVDKSGSSTIGMYDPVAPLFTLSMPARLARYDHTATLLVTGKVLIAGGNTGLDLEAELFDPTGVTFATTGSLVAPRRGHTATLLPDRRVLLAGGPGPTAELYFY